MDNVFLNYIVLIIGIGLIGLFWSLTATTESSKGVVRLTLTFVLWAVFSYTVQLLTGLSV